MYSWGSLPRMGWDQVMGSSRTVSATIWRSRVARSDDWWVWWWSRSTKIPTARKRQELSSGTTLRIRWPESSATEAEIWEEPSCWWWWSGSKEGDELIWSWSLMSDERLDLEGARLPIESAIWVGCWLSGVLDAVWGWGWDDDEVEDDDLLGVRWWSWVMDDDDEEEEDTWSVSPSLIPSDSMVALGSESGMILGFGNPNRTWRDELLGRLVWALIRS